jgi:GT2 family glycosyltransferase
MTNRKVFEAVGGFDERYFLFVEDVEFSWRAIIAGFEVSVAHDAFASHVGGASIKGGYLKNGEQYRTSVFRIRLRERNSIALLISCAPGWWFPFLIPTIIVHFIFVFAGSILLGSTELSKSILSGLFWNVKEFRRSIQRRNSLHRQSNGVRSANKRIKFGSPMLSVIRESGLPKLF